MLVWNQQHSYCSKVEDKQISGTGTQLGERLTASGRYDIYTTNIIIVFIIYTCMHACMHSMHNY